MCRGGKGEPAGGDEVGTIHHADNREQAAGREALFHRPETIGIPPAGDHQQTIGWQADIPKARAVGTAEFEHIMLSLAPEDHALIVRLPMQERSDQCQAKIPDRGVAAIVSRHQFMQGRAVPAASKKGVDPGRIGNGRAGPVDRSVDRKNHAYSPPELSETGRSICQSSRVNGHDTHGVTVILLGRVKGK